MSTKESDWEGDELLFVFVWTNFLSVRRQKRLQGVQTTWHIARSFFFDKWRTLSEVYDMLNLRVIFILWTQDIEDWYFLSWLVDLCLTCFISYGLMLFVYMIWRIWRHLYRMHLFVVTFQKELLIPMVTWNVTRSSKDE